MNDILLDKSINDLQIENGDLVIGYSNNQHQKHILIAEKGEYKKYPEIGVGIDKMLDNELYDEMLIEAKRNLKYDGMTIRNIAFTNQGTLKIEGNY